MNFSMKRLLLLALTGFVVLATGCSAVNYRIKKHPADYASLSAADQQLVSSGRVREGLSQQAVYLAWGKADSVRRGSRHGQAFETWIYLATDTVPDRPFISPLFYGPYAGWYRPYSAVWYSDFETTRTYPYRTAVFENGRLAAWSDEVR